MILVCRCNYRQDEKNEKSLVDYGHSPRLVPYWSSSLFRNKNEKIFIERCQPLSIGQHLHERYGNTYIL